VDHVYETTNQLIELSAAMTVRGAHVAASVTEKMAMKVAQEQPINENVMAIMDMIEITEHALRIAQEQKSKEVDAETKQALIHKTATLQAMLNRIEESIENC
jgi:site-specific recombinase